MLDILTIIPRSKKKTSTGWTVFNGVCCQFRGHNPDKRSRAGVKFIDNNNWSYHCFNCQFKCSYILGKPFSSGLRELLKWCGLDQLEIERLSFKSFASASVVDLYTKNKSNTYEVNFVEKSLPENARLITPHDQKKFDYIKNRSIDTERYQFFTVDNENRDRIIIPYYYKGILVGHTSRFLDNRKPKYVSEQQKGFIFNLDKQKPDYSVCILCEGQFDAMSIDGCAYMASTINEDQIRLLKSLHKKIIVVPDQDKSGLSICDSALENGFSVSIPEWTSDVKDINDAVVKYGKLPTLISILNAATSSKITVEMKRKKINGK